MLTFVLFWAYVLLTAGILFGLRQYRRASPIFYFPIILCMMATGTFMIMDLNLEADRMYAAMLFVALASFGVSTLIASNTLSLSQSYARHAARPVEESGQEEKQVAVAIFLMSVLITILYYRAIGYNVFLLMITGNLDEDYSNLRLATYSEGDYFAPGYVNQFKNVLLPLTAMACSVWLYRSRHRAAFYAFASGSVAFTVWALLGTGQRGYLIYTAASLVFGFFLFHIGRKSRIKPMYFALAGVPVLLLFGFMTGAYTGASDMGNGAVFSQMIDRFTSIQQESGMFGFRYVYPLQTSWFYEWWENVVGILPSSEGSTLAHEVHEAYYGSFRGTAPLSSTGSAYYNGGVVAVILLFGAMGWAYTYLYKRFLDGRKTMLRAVAYGFLFFYLSMYVSDAPTILLDNGVVAVVIFLLIIKIRVRRRGAPPTRMAVRR
ncbi:MAG: oligosaccharide repeat unit polymerase [Sphingomonadales bacterium]|nr:MAG: oligosaccharide repeat unit polymerase [Sphingomonadales bacterium]